MAAAELVATLEEGPKWPLVASSSRLLRLRLEEAPRPLPPPPGAVTAEGKIPAAEAMLLLVEAGIAALGNSQLAANLDDVVEHNGFDIFDGG